jgi:hypothetical protein
LSNKLPEQHAVNALHSVEYKLFHMLTRISDAYGRLCNATTHLGAVSDLKEVRAGASDLEKQIRQILTVEGVPPNKIRNVEANTQPNLDNLWANSWHFYHRYLGCRADAKLLNMTALYYLIKDTRDVAEVTPPERYYRGVIR